MTYLYTYFKKRLVDWADEGFLDIACFLLHSSVLLRDAYQASEMYYIHM